MRKEERGKRKEGRGKIEERREKGEERREKREGRRKKREERRKKREEPCLNPKPNSTWIIFKTKVTGNQSPDITCILT